MYMERRGVVRCLWFHSPVVSDVYPKTKSGTSEFRLTGAAGSIEPDDRGVKRSRRAGSQATARGVAPDGASWRGACYSPGLRADYWLGGALCLWQADRQLCRADPL